jgi:hypothetical protein
MTPWCHNFVLYSVERDPVEKIRLTIRAVGKMTLRTLSLALAMPSSNVGYLPVWSPQTVTRCPAV